MWVKRSGRKGSKYSFLTKPRTLKKNMIGITEKINSSYPVLACFRISLTVWRKKGKE